MTRTLIVVVAAAISFSSPVAAQNADDRLWQLMEETWQASLDASPLMASMFGNTGNKDKLDRLDDDSYAAGKARLDRAINTLGEIDYRDLTPENQTNYEVFEWLVMNERKALDFNGRYFTFNTISGWQSTFAQVSAATKFNSEQDYRDYLARLNEFGRFADENMALMVKGIEAGYTQPCEVLDGYQTSISGFISPSAEASFFYMPFAGMPDSYSEDFRNEMRAAGKRAVDEVVNPAYARYLEFFNETYLKECRAIVGLASVPGGREHYDFLVDYYTTVDSDADAVHELGLSEVKRIRGEMMDIIAEVEFEGDFKAFLEFLRTDPQFYTDDPEEYMERIARIAKKADGVLPEFFSYMPRNPYGLTPIADAIAPKATTAYYQPGTADLTRAGQYFVNLYKVETRPLYELTALTVHEAVPGHHMQISIAQELGNLPSFRQQYYFHAFGEGWGLYTEKLAVEMGLYDTPYDRFGQLVYEMWRACRLVVDTGMHAKGWTRQQAIDFMAANTALSLQNIVVEVDRYITYPGQALAYKLGELKIWELRRRAEAELGANFPLRDFHTLILTTGAVPLTVLEITVDKWIEEQR